MRVTVLVRPRDGILDPQGEAIRRSLAALGHPVSEVRAGKVFDLEIDADSAAGGRRLATEVAETRAQQPADRVVRGRGRGRCDRVTRVGVVTFPGACDDRDAAHALRLIGAEPVSLWHEETDLRGCDAVIVPGGFTFGDHLRPGAIAAHSPVMGAVARHADDGRPGAGDLQRLSGADRGRAAAGRAAAQRRPAVSLPGCRAGGRASDSAWLPGCAAGGRLTIPIKHHDGCWFADAGDRRRAGGERADPAFATPTTRTARWPTSPASPTRPGTSQR